MDTVALSLGPPHEPVERVPWLLGCYTFSAELPWAERGLLLSQACS